MMNRRIFLQQTSLITAGLLFHKPIYAKKLKKIGIQLYTLRNELELDVKDTLKKVASIGYKEIECFPSKFGHFWGWNPKEFRQFTEDLGLKIVSTHISGGFGDANTTDLKFASLKYNFKKFADQCAELGLKYIVCPYLPKEERRTLDDYKRNLQLFQSSGEICKKVGLEFCYHNHDFEFINLENQIPLEYMLQNSSKDVMNFELDLYWANKAGYNAVELIKKYPGRFKLYHVKDMDPNSEIKFAPVGKGTIAFDEIFKWNETSGVKHFMVEQDVCQLSPLESVEISFNHLSKLKF